MEGFDLNNLLHHDHWLAMDSNGSWFMYHSEPVLSGFSWLGSPFIRLQSSWFNLPTCENWEDSLIQVKDLIKD